MNMSKGRARTSPDDGTHNVENTTERPVEAIDDVSPPTLDGINHFAEEARRPENAMLFTWLVPKGSSSFEMEGARKPKANIAASAFTGMVSATDYVCVGAQAAMRNRSFRIAHIDSDVGTASSAMLLGHAMTRFITELPNIPAPFRPLVVIFEGPILATPEEFRDRFWEMLQRVADVDSLSFAPSTEVDSDPASPRFGFSCGGRGWFINGSFPTAKFLGRRTPLPTLICNLQTNFESLKKSGQFESIHLKNAERQIAADGQVNFYLANMGATADQSIQFVSVDHGSTQCPLQRIPRTIAERMGSLIKILSKR